MFRRIASAILLSCAGAVSAQDGASLPVDLELVLAVDTSRSMDYDELRLQRDGYAQALEHPAVTSALAMGRLGRAAILYFEWGGVDRHRVLIDWTLIETPQDAARVAAQLRSQPMLAQRGTSISSAMEQAAHWIETNDYEGTRKVIDISGDGPNNRGRPVVEVRSEVAAKGIEVNGLPFMIKVPSGAYAIPDLDIYYETCVITGESAFVIPIYEIERLIVSIRQKLVLEISGQMPPARMKRASAMDCLIGEKLRRQRQFSP